MDDIISQRLSVMQFQMVDERELEADREYLMQMYPAKARLIMVMVEDECDQLEFEGSPMLVPYPDKETMLGIARRIYDKISYKDDTELLHLVEVLVCNEYQVRRSRYKRRRHFF
ncbi:MAG: hypothetical protein NC393_07615 [Clostridium sp.]|nr:hypothetical protein [Clostridium sp.]MCM1171980.1 hypothetical protein [Clostridium sp.]MCM1208684.1 hypothetical protein [Ruminococcus sp.]MCM1287860.1 hypothetical protein [Clostridium sp.]